MVSTTTCCASPTVVPGGSRSAPLVGLLPLCATTVIEPWQRERVPQWEAVAPKNAGNVCPNCATAFIQLGRGI